MMRRVRLNVAVFAVLSVVLILWGMSNFLQVGPLRPDVDRVVAQFEESPGLQPGFPVTYLGIQVGTVDGVDLVPGMVEARLDLDPDQDVPREVTATVRRRSVVGEPYVGLDPVQGADLDGPTLGDGDVIPLESTSVLISYEEVFVAVDDLLAMLPADDLNTIVRELDVGLDGRVETLRSLLADTEDVTDTLAARTDVLQALTDEATRLTGTFAAGAGDIARGTDATALLTSTLRQDLAQLLDLLASAPSVLDRTAELLAETRPPLECLLASAADIIAQLDPDLEATVARIVAASPDFARILDAVVHDRVDGPWLAVDVILDATTAQENRYPQPLELPDVPSPATCDAGSRG